MPSDYAVAVAGSIRRRYRIATALDLIRGLFMYPPFLVALLMLIF